MATRIFSVTVHSRQGDESTWSVAKKTDSLARTEAIKCALKDWNKEMGADDVRYSEKDIAYCEVRLEAEA